MVKQEANSSEIAVRTMSHRVLAALRGDNNAQDALDALGGVSAGVIYSIAMRADTGTAISMAEWAIGCMAKEFAHAIEKAEEDRGQQKGA